MAKYTDFQLQKNYYDKASSYEDIDAIALSIKNILLSKPGNFPFNPSIGIDIRKYQFEFLDDQEISNIQKEIDKAISEHIPDIGLVDVIVRKINNDDGNAYLAISINTTYDGEDRILNFVIGNEKTGIINEIY